MTIDSPNTSASIANSTIHTLLNRRTMRAFKPDPIDPDVVEVLEKVAQQAATSSFNNAWSAIRITDPGLKKKIATIGRQEYIVQAPLLYIFLVDFRRNEEIARAKGVDTASATAFREQYNYNQGHDDAVLALHAMETAAQSLGLGALILGSVLNDVDALIDLLNLPKLVLPVLGLAIGKANQEPTTKPRMARNLQFFDNAYPAVTESTGRELLTQMSEFDEQVHRYYDLRHPDTPALPFTDMIAGHAQGKSAAKKRMGDKARAQGFNF